MIGKEKGVMLIMGGMQHCNNIGHCTVQRGCKLQRRHAYKEYQIAQAEDLKASSVLLLCCLLASTRLWPIMPLVLALAELAMGLC